MHVRNSTASVPSLCKAHVIISTVNYPVCIWAAELCVWSCRFVYMCMYVCMCGKKQAVWGLITWKTPVSVIYCLLVEFNGQKKLTMPGKEILKQSIHRMEEGFWKIILQSATHCLLAMQLMQCYQMQKANMPLQCRPTVSLQVQSVLTRLSTHRVCVLWNSSLGIQLCHCVESHVPKQNGTYCTMLRDLLEMLKLEFHRTHTLCALNTGSELSWIENSLL